MCNVMVLATVLACCLGSAAGICVLDNKKGWHLKCGVRDSYLFRLKDYGGLNANFDFSVGVGDESGFPLSIKNTKGQHHYYKRKDSTSRSSDIAEGEGGAEGGGRAGGGGGGGPRLHPPTYLHPPPSTGSSPVGHPSSSVNGVPIGQPSYESGIPIGPASQNGAPIGLPSSESRISIGPPQESAKRDTYSDSSSSSSTSDKQPLASSGTNAVIGSNTGKRNAAIGPHRVRSSQGSGVSSAGGGRSSWWSSFWPSRRRSDGVRRQSSSSSSSSPSFFSRLLAWLPWPFGEGSWLFGDSSSRAESRDSHFQVIHEHPTNRLPLHVPPQPFHSQPFNSQPFNSQPFNSQPINSQPFNSQPFNSQPFAPFTGGFNPNNNIFNPNGFNPPSPGFNPFGSNPNEFDPRNPFFNPFTPFPHPPPPSHHPPSPHSAPQPETVGPAMGDVLKVAANTPADTDHVPSFAAKMFVVREAPPEYYPPGYQPRDTPTQRSPATVEVPRTKFFCEEQRYLPGLYADTQLGCKVFHMCLPAAVGNTQTSFLCPNMTLFDQSILQCNWWYYVRCEESAQNYDANLPLALSYRRVNAAQLPLSAVGDYNSLSLLDVTARSARNLLKDAGDTGAVGKRMGLVASSKEEEEVINENEDDGETENAGNNDDNNKNNTTTQQRHGEGKEGKDDEGENETATDMTPYKEEEEEEEEDAQRYLLLVTTAAPYQEEENEEREENGEQEEEEKEEEDENGEQEDDEGEEHNRQQEEQEEEEDKQDGEQEEHEKEEEDDGEQEDEEEEEGVKSAAAAAANVEFGDGSDDYNLNNAAREMGKEEAGNEKEGEKEESDEHANEKEKQGEDGGEKNKVASKSSWPPEGNINSSTLSTLPPKQPPPPPLSPPALVVAAVGHHHTSPINVRISSANNNKLEAQIEEEKVEDIKVDTEMREINSDIYRRIRRKRRRRRRKRRSSEGLDSMLRTRTSPLLSLLHRRGNPMP